MKTLNIIRTFIIALICTACFSACVLVRANRFVPVVDAVWPVHRHPTEQALKEKIGSLSQLVAEIERKRLDSSYARSTLVLARDFIGYAADDDRNGRPERAKYVRGYLDEALDTAVNEARVLIRNPRLNRPIPRPPLRNILIRNGAFYSGKTNVMFGGVGHFGKVREDIPKFHDYGFNLIQIEIGPNSVVTGPGPNDISVSGIQNDILKNLDYADSHGVMVNLLLSPHYFPKWALDQYPELNQCGHGFIKYCVSDQNARVVIRRFLQTLIPLVKDKRALQSYTLANEPQFYEHGAAAMRQYREWLMKKYGSIEAINRAWHKNFRNLDKLYTSEDFLSVNASARADWVEFHNRFGTDFLYWMKSVIRTMDKHTPVHIKFMDDMFENYETYWGVDREALDRFSDISGNDSTIRYPGVNGYAFDYFQNAAFYDFLKSIQPRRPIQNSENHIIADDSPRFYPYEYIRAALWLQYLHGMAASTIWVWERNDSESLGNNILSRPNCVAAATRTTLDVRRLASEVTALANNSSPIAIYYSQTSRVFQSDFRDKWLNAYELALYNGFPVRIVTDSAIRDGNIPRDIRLLIIPEYVYTTDALYTHIIDYIRRGGRVIALGRVFRMNQIDRKRDTADWTRLECASARAGCVEMIGPVTDKTRDRLFAKLHRRIRDLAPSPDLDVTYADGAPVRGVEYRSARLQSRRIAYIVNALDHPVVLNLRTRGKAILTTSDLINRRIVASRLTLAPMEIVLFRF
jgi:hypothetical protein